MTFKIVIARREYATHLDGVNRFIFALADGLSAIGHEVHVASFSFRGTSYSELERYVRSRFDVRGDIRVHSLTKSTRPEVWPTIAITWYWKGSALLRRLRPDVVILNGIVPLRTQAVRIAVNHGINTEILSNTNVLERPIFKAAVKYLYHSQADVCVCVSQELASEFKSFTGIESTVLPIPIDASLYASDHSARQEPPIILHVGTTPRKNAELSIKSVKAMIEKQHVDAKLIVVGPTNEYVERLRSEYQPKMSGNLEFAFDVDYSILRNLMNSARVLILPSKYEALPYTVLEAFASGLPVVTSDAVPAGLVLDGHNGYRIREFDPDEYARRLVGLIQDDATWKALSLNARQTALEYSHTKVTQAYEHLMEEMIKRKR
jgi:glycosyltransferase involved in cell wall biosynthesis